MKFNLEAAKAYIGAILMNAQEVAAQGNGIAASILHGLESAIGIDFPASIDGLIIAGVASAIGYLAVYFVPNKQAA